MNEFLTIEQDFTESRAWKQHSASQRERSRNGKNKAQQDKWRKICFGKFEPKANWSRCFTGREEYAT